MTTHCLNCYEHTIENDICLKCKSSFFSFPINFSERQQSIEYKNFISKITKKLDIEEGILHNLINFDFFDMIPNVKFNKSYYEEQINISIPQNTCCDTFKQSIPFIFSHLDKFNNIYYPQEFILNPNDPIFLYKVFLFKNNYNDLIECVFNKDKNKYHINVYIPYDKSKTIIADQDILSENELKKLKNNLLEQYDSSPIKIISFDKSFYFSFVIDLNNYNLSLPIYEICNEIYDLIDNFHCEVNAVIEQYKEKNSKIFERALLEKNIEKF